MAASIPDHSHTSGKICLCIPRVVKEGCLHHKSKETLILIFFAWANASTVRGGTIARNDDTIKLKLVWDPIGKTILRLKKLLSLIPTCFAGTKGNCSVLHRCWHALWSFATRHHLSDASTWPPNSITWGQSGFGWLDISNHGAQKLNVSEVFVYICTVLVRAGVRNDPSWLYLFFKGNGWNDARLPPAAVHHAAPKSPPSNQIFRFSTSFKPSFLGDIVSLPSVMHHFASFGRIYWQTTPDCHMFKLQSNIFHQLKTIWNEPMLAEQHYFAWRALFGNVDGCMYTLVLTYGRMVSSKARRYCRKCIPPFES